ncbi:MAG: hypothetical protein C0404_14005 [Verrucomicrobia bacterium]|nr:hypothetical protein [Verrucomicrobiota bacterium]
MFGESRRNRSGVSLIIVLGILSLLAIIVIAFARSARDTRVSARCAANIEQADELVYVALARAMEAVDASMTNWCYPYWETNSPAYMADVLCSTGYTNCHGILSGRVSNSIPGALWSQAFGATGACEWIDIDVNGRTNGRIAYMVINCSGLLDANRAGGWPRGPSIDISEIDITDLPELADMNAFTNNRSLHRNYATLDEFNRLNRGISPPSSNFFTYSFDADPDMYFTNSMDLGLHSIFLTNKCFICYPNPSDTNFIASYFIPLTNYLVLAGFTDATDQVAWNIVNYFDHDLVINNSDTNPWLSNCGVEPAPLINEVALRPVIATTNNVYELLIELWYPFAPAETAAGEYTLSVQASPGGSFVTNIPAMQFGSPTEFTTYVSPPIVFSNGIVVSAATPVDVSIQVYRGDPTSIVDMALLPQFTDTNSYSVVDPRINGRPECWTNHFWTIGATNACCDPWAGGGQGVPIFHSGQGNTYSIGELGYVFTSRPWQSINLFSAQGGALLDWMTLTLLPSGHQDARVNANTRQTDVLRALFHNMPCGWTNSASTSTSTLATADVELIVNALTNATYTGECCTFSGLFSRLGADSAFMAAFKPDGTHTNGDLREQIFRNVVEMLSFRQNLFTIVVSVEAFGADQTTVVAKKRALAVVVRDAYTGKSFIHYLKPLTQ